MSINAAESLPDSVKIGLPVGPLRPRSNNLPGFFVRLACLLGCICSFNLVRGQDVLTPSDVMLSSEAASQEALGESAAKASLRFLGLDVYPRAAVNVMYDDNILISSRDPISDLRWTLLPGLAVAAGDIGLYLAGPVTLAEIRNLLNDSLLDDSARPQRYVGVGYAPAVNFYTENSQYNGVDQIAGLASGYAFSRLAIGLDMDFFSGDVKNNGVGALVAESIFNTRLRFRYQLTDRSDAEVTGYYRAFEYEDPRYKGYQEFRNEDWYNRLVGARLQVGLGAAFGVVYPEANPDQFYQQLLVRGLYVVSGKLDLRGTVGIEFRQYASGPAGTIEPVFNLSATYQPRVSTTFTLEAFRRQDPSYAADYNNISIGFAAGVRQQLLGRLTANLNAGYENVAYVPLTSGISINRTDNYYSVRVNLQYEVNRHWTTTLFWVHLQDASNLRFYSYVNNMVGVRAAWDY